MLHNINEMALFPKLPDEALEEIKQHGSELELNVGDVLFSEGDSNYNFHIVLEGEIEITKLVANERVVLAIHRRGDFMGELSMLTSSKSIATARAIAPSRVLEIGRKAFKQILSQGLPIADVILTALAGRTREVEIRLRQQEKMAALGKMSAGLAHELNNPGAAARRSASILRDNFETLQTQALQLNLLSKDQLKLIIDIKDQAIEYSANPPELNILTQSDKEDEVTDWLEDHQVNNGWKIASTLVNAGLDISKLDVIADNVPVECLSNVLCWLDTTITFYALINEIEQSTARISDLVKAIKGYSYMDQAPLQEIDIHNGIENTLLILHHRLKKGIVVHKNYDYTLPRINAYASELNQVWTNLIDNAIDAMNGKGDLTIRTYRESSCIVVEIIDTGLGIPQDIQSRIFEPFFTTKDVGKGTGLGLEIAYRIIVNKHKGDIHFNSKPGNTCFQVHLPIEPTNSSCERVSQ
jgi:signal transduction histidine kinase